MWRACNCPAARRCRWVLRHSPPFLGCPPIADLVVWCDAGGAACRQAGPGKHSYHTYLFCTGTASALLQEAKFLILEQAFLEALQAGQGTAALALLREQLAPLGVNPARLHRLAACLMGGRSPVAQVLAFPGSGSSSDSEEEEEEELKEQRLRRHDGAVVDMVAQRHRVLRKLQVGRAGPGMHGSAGTERLVAALCTSCNCAPSCAQLWSAALMRCAATGLHLQAVVPPDLMLPERRLEELVEQVGAGEAGPLPLYVLELSPCLCYCIAVFER